ncbi:vegetative cell wall protein gp1-like [Mustela erminea]|uniref:vegetative cell wall protein gp1-like n=1 Tax=Mustela erminea TaxID=36723 RepID=UPI001386E575|nr:vegetative cell wall protein gp1-like [Mustela erminea]
MFCCCLPKPRGCRQRRARPPNTSPHWAGRVRLPRRLWPFGKKNQKATDELGRRREDPHSSPTPESPVLGRPSLPPRPLPAVLHWIVVLDTEPTEAKSKASPAKELDPLPTSATPEGHMVSGVREPTDPAPAPASSPSTAAIPSPGPARTTAPSPGPA